MRRGQRSAGLCSGDCEGNAGHRRCLGSPEGTQLVAAVFADQLRAPVSRELMIGEGWTDAGSFEAIIADVLTWGERPDAFFAVLVTRGHDWRALSLR